MQFTTMQGAPVCPKCARKVDPDWQLCPSCGAPIGAETKTVFSEPSSASLAEEGRFPAGTVLAGRYRVLGLIGQGVVLASHFPPC